MADFLVRIQFDAVKRFHIPCRRLLELRNAVVRISAVFPFRRLFTELADNGRKRHVVRFADSHVDDLNARILCHCLAFCAFDLFKFIDFRVFAEHISADSFGKIVLKEAFSHCNLLLVGY